MLVYVPKGEFTMGSENGDPDQSPVHKATLNAFFIDQTEVTNKHYAACVSAGVCASPFDTSSYKYDNYYGNPKFDNFPVVYVSWNDANTYCVWAQRRLPTEAEWEKAARGSKGGFYPWGNSAPNARLLSHRAKVGDVTAVGSYPDGASPYGAYDMAGNVWEWVNDWYGETYYKSSPSSSPLGPDTGEYRVLRGGSWYYASMDVHSAIRSGYYPSHAYYFLGFRCALSLP